MNFFERYKFNYRITEARVLVNSVNLFFFPMTLSFSLSLFVCFGTIYLSLRFTIECRSKFRRLLRCYV